LSIALSGLLKWVLAMVNYYNVAKGVEPKRKKVAEAEKNLRMAQKDLAETKDQLAALNTQLAALRAQFHEKTAEQQVSAAHSCSAGTQCQSQAMTMRC
jgi:dynein heavy chain